MPKEYYTIEEAAACLKVRAGYILGEIIGGLSKFSIDPSVYIKKPVALKQQMNTRDTKGNFTLLDEYKYMSLAGHFDIFGIRDWNVMRETKETGYFCLSSTKRGKTSYHVTLYRFPSGEATRGYNGQDDIEYLLTEPKAIHYSELLIARNTLLKYASNRGIEFLDTEAQADNQLNFFSDMQHITIPVNPDDEPAYLKESIASIKHFAELDYGSLSKFMDTFKDKTPQLTKEEYVAKAQKEGLSITEIAETLDTKYGTSLPELGLLLPASNAVISLGSIKTRGKRLRASYKKNKR